MNYLEFKFFHTTLVYVNEKIELSPQIVICSVINNDRIYLVKIYKNEKTIIFKYYLDLLHQFVFASFWVLGE